MNYLFKEPYLNLIHINQIILGIVHGLRFLYKKKIVHRDIKAENIMLDRNYCVKFIDWGSCSNMAIKKNKFRGLLKN